MNHRRAPRVVTDVHRPDAGEYPRGGTSSASSYGGGVLRTVRPAALRWAFLVAIALGIVGMHHLAMPEAGHHQAGPTTVAVTAAVVSAEADPACCDGMPGDHGGMHDLLHLCLAVLCAAAGLLLAWLLLRRGAMASQLGLRAPLAAFAGRSPPIVHRSPTSLSSLCVLRL